MKVRIKKHTRFGQLSLTVEVIAVCVVVVIALLLFAAWYGGIPSIFDKLGWGD